ncbi:hypothetical protein VNO78_07734 [Psophocarpus tetragonolobus]|uniref:Uncharacterized protein n=1 Tax=Psophocarpus tetragonolobus TaxID=3891 RepID=A0AAN9XRY2_PSOTE
MNNRKGRVAAAEFANRNRLRSQNPLPKRGQIKTKIAANAFNSIIAVISRASSSGLNSPRKKYFDIGCQMKFCAFRGYAMYCYYC